jgi:hypothetical protein
VRGKNLDFLGRILLMPLGAGFFEEEGAWQSEKNFFKNMHKIS